MSDLNREFLAERDLRIFKMRAAGVSNNDIAKRFGLTTKAVSAALKRQMERMNREAYLAYPEVVRLELERLDMLQQAIWPMTQPRRIELDQTDEQGQPLEEVVPPDLDAVKTVLNIADRRAKLLGLDISKIDISMDMQADVRSTLHGAEKQSLDAHDPRAEAVGLLELMASTRVLPPDVVKSIMSQMGQETIEDAEIVEVDDGSG